MARKFFRKYLPSHESVREHRYLSRFGAFLKHPNLWRLNRGSVAGGVAIGLFSGLVPGPFQVLSAAIFAIAFRVNLPGALVVTHGHGEASLAFAPEVPVRTTVETFPLEKANEALARLREGQISGAAVLVP